MYYFGEFFTKCAIPLRVDFKHYVTDYEILIPVYYKNIQYRL